MLANIGKGKGRQGKRRMDARAFDKSKLPSRRVTEGSSRAPRRSHDARHVYDIGRALSDGGDLNAPWLPVSDTTAAQTLEIVKCDTDQEVVCRVAHPISATGEVVGLQGSRGAIVKVAGMTRLQFCGPARVFDCEEDCLRAVESRGQRAGGKLARITDGRFCEGTRGVSIGRVGPEAAVGGPSAGIGGGDMIASDAEKGVLDWKVAQARLAIGRNARQAPANPYQSGTLRICADQVGPARRGAVAHAGSRAEVVGYADI